MCGSEPFSLSPPLPSWDFYFSWTASSEARRREAPVGIEPTIEDLQSSALPLGHPAKGAREAYRFASTLLNG